MNTTNSPTPLPDTLLETVAGRSAFQRSKQPKEWKIVPLRECPTPTELQLCDRPELAAQYLRLHLPQNPYFDPERECMVVLFLNTRRRVKGHQLVSIGTMDAVQVDPRCLFRLAIMASAAAIILAHNHPSGDQSPSDADIRITRDIMRAGQILKLEVLDHLILGMPGFSSLREMGFMMS